MTEFFNSQEKGDFLKDVLGLNSKDQMELFELFEVLGRTYDASGYISGPVAQAWINWYKGIKYELLPETRMNILVEVDDDGKNKDKDIHTFVTKSMVTMNFYPVCGTENLYRSKKNLEIYVKYGPIPTGTQVVFPLTDTGGDYAYRENTCIG